jgi:hypothetical protein
MTPMMFNRVQVARVRVRQAADALRRELDGDIGEGVRLMWCAEECARVTRELRELLREVAR